ncbi:adenosylcobinamide-GDP ribazoletransferase [Flavobacterium crassostreae]|uniref:Adenosylcobinamide-GDP ribazoletransferase n=1 Tax=Flavobacterium crassostreae TaxID=1763534 RepID=A0A1B9E7F0_9FLAO|nr:adenosylcobinamide-GDP ribazoletransferase [Flavobacterium crassostreae]OCB77875.1 adenosylcobinamide-GDP ribazoletransferase [Flavobacterium crassostreae]
MKKQVHLFFTALLFYTRIPCPKNIDHNPEYLNQATRYFPLIGWIVGAVAFGVFVWSNYLTTPEIAVVVSMVISVLVTGAFHEDGFADVCDGFGGGWTKEKILLIMKDSAIGAYGAIGVVLLLLLKFMALIALVKATFLLSTTPYLFCFGWFVTAHSLSRLAAISIIFTEEYSREDASSKSKPIAQSFTWVEVLGAFFFGLLPLLALAYLQWQVLLVLLPVFGTRFLMARYFKKWISGYTGDCLGATQQVCEVVYYITMVVLWKFI